MSIWHKIKYFLTKVLNKITKVLASYHNSVQVETDLALQFEMQRAEENFRKQTYPLENNKVGCIFQAFDKVEYVL